MELLSAVRISGGARIGLVLVLVHQLHTQTCLFWPTRQAATHRLADVTSSSVSTCASSLCCHPCCSACHAANSAKRVRCEQDQHSQHTVVSTCSMRWKSPCCTGSSGSNLPGGPLSTQQQNPSIVKACDTDLPYALLIAHQPPLLRTCCMQAKHPSAAAPWPLSLSAVQLSASLLHSQLARWTVQSARATAAAGFCCERVPATDLQGK